MKKFRKVLCFVMSVILAVCSVSLLAAAYDEKGKKSAAIFVDGIASSDLINAETGETMFPPQAKPIIKAVNKVLPTLVSDIKKNDYSATAGIIADAVNPIFAPIACDENGLPKVKTKIDYEYPDSDSIKAVINGTGEEKYIRFSYDWRLSVLSIADELHSFIEYVMKEGGLDSVSLIGFSMGTCVVMSYLKLYDYQYVDGVVLLAGGYNGVSCCGQPFADMLGFDSDAIVRYFEALLGDSFAGVGVKALMRFLNVTGTLGKAVNIADALTAEINDILYKDVFVKSFATMPGMWALIPLEYYEQAKDTIINGFGFSDEYIKTIDRYHYEVQADMENIINGILDRGINFGIVSKYGFPNTPCIEDINSMADGVIDTRFSSFGATCADVTETLGDDYVQKIDNGHDCVSPDNMIDASTCKFVDYTWFVKNSFHSNDMEYSTGLCLDILNADTQPTVWDFKYPEFNIMTKTGIKPLTSDNDSTLYTVSFEGDTVLSVLGDFIIDFKNAVKSAFGR